MDVHSLLAKRSLCLVLALIVAIGIGCGKKNATPTAAATSDSASPDSPAKPDSQPAEELDSEIGAGSEAVEANLSGSKFKPSPAKPKKKKNTADAWGDLKGRFVYDGDAPEPQELKVTKDISVCSKIPPLDESLVVNKENGGVADVLVWIYLERGEDLPPVHPSYDETAEAEVTLDNKNCRFEPHTCLLRTTQTLVAKNSDSVSHNVNLGILNNIVPAGQTLKFNFDQTQRMPLTAVCNIHPWMTGLLLVKNHPYMAASDKDGNFEIKNMPAGKWTIQFWQKRCGYLKQVVLNDKETKWKRGRVEITIEPGVHDLGEIRLSPTLLKQK